MKGKKVIEDYGVRNTNRRWLLRVGLNRCNGREGKDGEII